MPTGALGGRDHVLPGNLRAVAVTRDGRFLGLVTIGDLRKVAQDQWPTATVDQVMTPATELPPLSPFDGLTVALDRFRGDVPLLPVVRDSTLDRSTPCR